MCLAPQQLSRIIRAFVLMPVHQVTQIMSLVMTLLKLVDAAVVLDAIVTDEWTSSSRDV